MNILLAISLVAFSANTKTCLDRTLYDASRGTRPNGFDPFTYNCEKLEDQKYKNTWGYFEKDLQNCKDAYSWYAKDTSAPEKALALTGLHCHHINSQAYHDSMNIDPEIFRMIQSDGTLKKWKRITDKFGEYDFYEIPCAFSGSGFCIDERVDADESYFRIRRTASKICFDKSARIVLLMKDGTKSELNADSDFRCDGVMDTEGFTGEQFNSPITSIRIDNGIHSVFDISISAAVSKAMDGQLQNIDEIGAALRAKFK